MMRLAIICLCLLLAGSSVFADDPGIDQPVDLDSLATSAALALALYDETPLPGNLVHPDGYFIWQQPGVALAITGIGSAETQPTLYYSPDKMQALLQALPGYSFGNPIVYPRETDGEFMLEPQVWLLCAEESQERLATYMEGYSFWIDVNAGAEFIVPDDDALATAGALVYLDSGGPVEFHFQRDADGELKLRHIFIWDYFSA